MSKGLASVEGGRVVFGEAVARIADSLNPLGAVGRVVAESFALTTEMRRINLEGRQNDADKEIRLAQLQQRHAESSAALRHMHKQLGNADSSARAMSQCMVNMQREVVKPDITLDERKLYRGLTESFTELLVQHHGGQGEKVVGAIDKVLNGAGAVAALGAPRTRPAQENGRNGRNGRNNRNNGQRRQ